MQKPLPENQSSTPTFSRGIDLAVPESQPGLTVTTPEWERLKKCIREIEVSENLWVGAAFFFLGGAISFGTGAIALLSQDPVVSQGAEKAGSISTTEVIFLCATFALLAAGVVALIGFWQTRRHRTKDIDSVMERMEDIENIYKVKSNAPT